MVPMHANKTKEGTANTWTPRQGRVSKKTETDSNQPAKPDQRVTQRLPKLPGPIVRQTQGKRTARPGQRYGLFRPHGTYERNVRNRLIQAVTSFRSNHSRHHFNRILFCIHRGMNLTAATDNLMSGDFCVSKGGHGFGLRKQNLHTESNWVSLIRGTPQYLNIFAAPMFAPAANNANTPSLGSTVSQPPPKLMSWCNASIAQPLGTQ